MFLEQTKHPIQIIKESYKYLKTQPKYVGETWLIVILLTIIFWAANYIIGTFVGVAVSFVSLVSIATVFSALWMVLNMLIDITIDLWTTIYVFLRFKEKTKE
ncbi:MAG TPA: hypothetical protein HA370_06025 [Nanoarchaeota archaeon]|nr:hypothetical protein [Nanoarchaeota archaeon]